MMANYYKNICMETMGLNWAAHAASGWRCNIYDRKSAEGADCAGAPERRDFVEARVAPAAFARFVAAALDGNFSALKSEFVASIRRPNRVVGL